MVEHTCCVASMIAYNYNSYYELLDRRSMVDYEILDYDCIGRYKQSFHWITFGNQVSKRTQNAELDHVDRVGKLLAGRTLVGMRAGQCLQVPYADNGIFPERNRIAREVPPILIQRIGRPCDATNIDNHHYDITTEPKSVARTTKFDKNDNDYDEDDYNYYCGHDDCCY